MENEEVKRLKEIIIEQAEIIADMRKAIKRDLKQREQVNE